MKCDCPCHAPGVFVTGVYSPCCGTPGKPAADLAATERDCADRMEQP